MCIRDRAWADLRVPSLSWRMQVRPSARLPTCLAHAGGEPTLGASAVSYTHLRAHETSAHL
eukprot:735055-Alexandrium_andersonii.AAC.1